MGPSRTDIWSVFVFQKKISKAVSSLSMAVTISNTEKTAANLVVSESARSVQRGNIHSSFTLLVQKKQISKEILALITC